MLNNATLCRRLDGVQSASVALLQKSAEVRPELSKSTSATHLSKHCIVAPLHFRLLLCLFDDFDVPVTVSALAAGQV